MMNTQSRATASLLGLAIGDALGAPVEFQQPGEFKPVTDYRYSYVWQTPPGYYTDDTSMAICLAESILAHNTVDPVDLLQRFARWYTQGENSSTGRCFDIGTTTRAGIQAFIKSGQTQAANLHYHSGNGSIMRLAPVVVRWWNQPSVAVEQARIQGVTTHGSDECVTCCSQLTELLCAAIVDPQPVLRDLHAWASTIPPAQVPNTGRASHTLMAARWCVGSTTSFESAVLTAVNLGGDADTIGAVTAQIAGACYGMQGVPPAWSMGLLHAARLMRLADQLYVLSEQSQSD